MLRGALRVWVQGFRMFQRKAFLGFKLLRRAFSFAASNLVLPYIRHALARAVSGKAKAGVSGIKRLRASRFGPTAAGYQVFGTN